MINSIIEAFGFDFFVRGLVIWVILSLIYSIIWIFVVLRKESNITHTISNFALLWIAVWLYFWLNLNIAAAVSSMIWSLVIIKFQNTKIFSHDSIMEFMAQISIALAIVIVSQLSWYRSDINNFLFWNILALSREDFWFTLILWVVIISIFVLFRKVFTQIIISSELTKSRWINVNLVNVLFMLLIGIAISLWIKIVWVLLIWAFMIIPPNISKIFSVNFSQMRIYSVLFWAISTFLGILAAYILDAPTWATIIISMWVVLTLSLIFRRLLKFY